MLHHFLDAYISIRQNLTDLNLTDLTDLQIGFPSISERGFGSQKHGIGQNSPIHPKISIETLEKFRFWALISNNQD